MLGTKRDMGSSFVKGRAHAPMQFSLGQKGRTMTCCQRRRINGRAGNLWPLGREGRSGPAIQSCLRGRLHTPGHPSPNAPRSACAARRARKRRARLSTALSSRAPLGYRVAASNSSLQKYIPTCLSARKAQPGTVLSMKCLRDAVQQAPGAGPEQALRVEHDVGDAAGAGGRGERAIPLRQQALLLVEIGDGPHDAVDRVPAVRKGALCVWGGVMTMRSARVSELCKRRTRHGEPTNTNPSTTAYHRHGTQV